MSPATSAGAICPRCGCQVLELNHGRERLCGCTGLSAPRPSPAPVLVGQKSGRLAAMRRGET